MASTKVGTKAKLKEDKGKLVNTSGPGEPDSSLLRKPIQTSITGFAQARKIFDTATEELKSLLTTECDLLYECKVCRNLFRSLANFIAHKRVYCKEMFNSMVHGHFIKSATTMSEILKIKHVEEGYQEFLKNKDKLAPEAPIDRVPLSKDITAVMENLMKKKEVTIASEEALMEVAVQNIPTSAVAVFQNVVKNDDSGDDMCSEVTEIDGFLAKDSAVLKEDGKFETCTGLPLEQKSPREEGKVATEELEGSKEEREASGEDREASGEDRGRVPKEEDEQVIQISDDDDNSQLSCKICDIQFSTRKTLKFHMKYKHVPDRLVYPCTDCCDVFATSWSVLRHLYRVHRKTLTQIRRMRELVQSRAFRMNNMPSSYVRKKNIKKAITEEKLTAEERMDQENQAWMDNMESDSELPRCGGCGRSFERRAALAAHTYTCQTRTRALARKPSMPDKREILVKKDSKPPPLVPKPQPVATNEAAAKVSLKESSPILVDEDKESPVIEEENKEDKSENKKEETKNVSEEMEVDQVMEEPKEEASKDHEESDSESIVLSFPEEVEKANMEALRKKMADFVERSGICKVCKRKFTTPSHLCRHMASHLSWRRYGCKLCSYVNYDRNRLVVHAQTIHKLKGSDEFYTSIMRVVPASEALAQSTTPTLADEEWNGREEVESSESDEVCVSSDDESESGSSRTEPAKPNRRKQTFKPVKISKSKSSSPVKDEEKPEKSAAKRSSQVPIDKVMQVILGDNGATDNKQKTQPEMKEGRKEPTQVETDSRRPVRKRMRPKKDEDFEYDFSNVKWESNSYEIKAATASRNISNKRKSTADSSPSESSPEKTDKSDKEQAKDDKMSKQAKIDDKKKCYAGALATMSDRAVAQSRAHFRPGAAFNPSRLLLLHKVPFDVREHFRKIQTSKLVVTQDIVNKRKSISIASAPPNVDNEVKTDLTDIEKQIDEANARNNVFKATKIIGRSSLDAVKQAVAVNKKQKVIVMKRVSAGGKNKQAGGTIQFQRIQQGGSTEQKQVKPADAALKPALASLKPAESALNPSSIAENEIKEPSLKEKFNSVPENPNCDTKEKIPDEKIEIGTENGEVIVPSEETNPNDPKPETPT